MFAPPRPHHKPPPSCRRAPPRPRGWAPGLPGRCGTSPRRRWSWNGGTEVMVEECHLVLWKQRCWEGGLVRETSRYRQSIWQLGEGRGLYSEHTALINMSHWQPMWCRFTGPNLVKGTKEKKCSIKVTELQWFCKQNLKQILKKNYGKIYLFCSWFLLLNIAEFQTFDLNNNRITHVVLTIILYQDDCNNLTQSWVYYSKIVFFKIINDMRHFYL